MPRDIKLGILCTGVILFLAFPGSTVRADSGPVVLSIGGNAWYSDWRPPWRDSKRVMTVPYFTPVKYFVGSVSPASVAWKINSFSIAPGAMGGPSISINIFNKVIISSVFTIGKFIAVSQGPSLVFLNTKYRRDILKYDSDSIISFALHRFVRLFIGFKYQGYDYDEKMHFIVYSGGGTVSKGKAFFRSYGPAFGFNLFVPVYQSLYLLIGTSASYLISTAAYDFKYNLIFSPVSPEFGHFSKDHMKALANNNTVSFAYAIGKSGVTLALGFRHQMVYYWQKNKYDSFINYNQKFEHFLGGSFSVIYSINLVKQDSNT